MQESIWLSRPIAEYVWLPKSVADQARALIARRRSVEKQSHRDDLTARRKRALQAQADELWAETLALVFNPAHKARWTTRRPS